MADDMYGGELPEDGLNEELDAEGVAVPPADAGHRQYEEAQSEIDQLKKRLAEMEAEAATLKDVGTGTPVRAPNQVPRPAPAVGPPQHHPHPHSHGHGHPHSGMQMAGVEVENTPEKEAELQAVKEEVDGRSVYVGNVDYLTSPEELQVHFQGCGTINRVTILTDKFGHPKGYAFVEFLEPDAVKAASALNDTEIHGRKIKVVPKRTNVPGMKRGRGRGRGAPFGRGGGGGGGPFYGRGAYYGGWYPPPPPTFFRGRGRGGRSWYSPY
ncbi:hypothetical protein BSKO_12739 [Bryopsis sp. KO-2023]|nr:hypothetical protein BSKO_12739 [Bryopsis sp. KO-2023]